MTETPNQNRPPILAAMRVRDAAKALSVRENEVRRMLRSGELRGFRTPGGHWRVEVAGLLGYVDQRCNDEEAARLARATIETGDRMN